jgi:hypothetical protein
MDSELISRFWVAPENKGGLGWTRGMTLYLHNGQSAKKNFMVIASVRLDSEVTPPPALGQDAEGYLLCKEIKMIAKTKTYYERKIQAAAVCTCMFPQNIVLT